MMPIRFCSAVLVLLSLLVTAQIRAAEITLLVPHHKISSAFSAATSPIDEKQKIWPLLPDSLIYDELISSIITKGQDSIKSEIEQSRQQNRVSWQSLYASASSFHVMSNAALLPVRDGQNLSFDNLLMKRQDLASLAFLPSDVSVIEAHHLHQYIDGAPYVIWPHTTGYHSPDRLISWPLKADIAFADGPIDMIGQLTLRTDDYQAEMHFADADERRQIFLSFATAAHINRAVFHSPADLTYNDESFDSWVMIAQLFGKDNAESQLPLWGQFAVLAPVRTSPIKGHFTFMPE